MGSPRACAARAAAAVALAGAILCTLATPAFAAGAGSVSIEKNGTPIFSVEAKDADFPAIADLFSRWRDVKRDAEAKLTTQLTPILREKLAGKANLKGLVVDIWDNALELSFTGTGGGNIALDVTLPTIQFVASASKSGFDGDAYVYLGPAKLRMTYNIFTGVAGGVTVLSLPSRVETYVSSGSFLTGLLDVLTLGFASDFAHDLAQDAVEAAVADVGTQLTSALATISVQSFGLDAVLPDLTYEGVDVDQLVRDAIAGVFVGPLVSIRIWYGTVEGTRRYDDFLTVDLWNEYVLRVQHHYPGDHAIPPGSKK